MKTPSLMTERRKHALNTIDEALNVIDDAIKQERAALDKLEQMKANCVPRPAPTPIAIVGAPGEQRQRQQPVGQPEDAARRGVIMSYPWLGRSPRGPDRRRFSCAISPIGHNK
jgi:hypothetical protein